MFKPTKATTVQEYLANVPQERKEAMHFLHEFIQKTVPNLQPHFASNMIGYGSFPYVNYKKETIQWPVISLANQKHYISVYVCDINKDSSYIAESMAGKLGKVSVGKSCIRLKKLADVNLDVLTQVLLAAAKNPGLC